VLLDWLIETSCYAAEVGQKYSERKVESVRDSQQVKKTVDVTVFVLNDNVKINILFTCVCVAVHPLCFLRGWEEAPTGEEIAQEKFTRRQNNNCPTTQGNPAAVRRNIQ